MENKSEVEKTWNETALKVLSGKRIKLVRYMTDDEAQFFGWSKKPIVIALDDKERTILWASSDDEGNEGGAIHYTSLKEKSGVIPTL